MTTSTARGRPVLRCDRMEHATEPRRDGQRDGAIRPPVGDHGRHAGKRIDQRQTSRRAEDEHGLRHRVGHRPVAGQNCDAQRGVRRIERAGIQHVPELVAVDLDEAGVIGRRRDRRLHRVDGAEQAAGVIGILDADRPGMLARRRAQQVLITTRVDEAGEGPLSQDVCRDFDGKSFRDASRSSSIPDGESDRGPVRRSAGEDNRRASRRRRAPSRSASEASYHGTPRAAAATHGDVERRRGWRSRRAATRTASTGSLTRMGPRAAPR